MSNNTMSQSEIDNLMAEMMAFSESGEDKEEVQYHKMICVHCRKVIDFLSYDIHNIYFPPSSPRYGRCKKSSYGHRFVSKEYLAALHIPGFSQETKIVAEPQTKMVPKGSTSKTEKKAG